MNKDSNYEIRKLAIINWLLLEEFLGGWRSTGHCFESQGYSWTRRRT